MFACVLAAFVYNQTTITYTFYYCSKFEEEYIYLTEWGVWLTFLYFTCTTFNMLSHQCRGKPLWKGVWKLETALFITAFVDEFAITVVFWSVLNQIDD
jgi:hypothetical protein